MNKLLAITIASLCTITVATGCGLKLEDDKKDEPIAPPQKPVFPDWKDSRESISGPELSGLWISRCNFQKVNTENQKEYRQFVFTFNKTAITRVEKIYTDKACSLVKSNETFKGFYRYVKAYGENSFEIEYALRNEKLTINVNSKYWLKDDILYISDMASGDLTGFQEDEPLFKNGVDPRGHMLKPGNYTTPEGAVYSVELNLKDDIKTLVIGKDAELVASLQCDKNTCSGSNTLGNSVDATLKSETKLIYKDASQSEQELILTLIETE